MTSTILRNTSTAFSLRPPLVRWALRQRWHTTACLEVTLPSSTPIVMGYIAAYTRAYITAVKTQWNRCLLDPPQPCHADRPLLLAHVVARLFDMTVQLHTRAQKGADIGGLVTVVDHELLAVTVHHRGHWGGYAYFPPRDARAHEK